MTVKNYQKKLDECTNGSFEYLGREENISRLKIKCRDCGYEFSRSFQMFQKSGFKCPNCSGIRNVSHYGADEFLKKFQSQDKEKKWEILDLDKFNCSSDYLHFKCKKCGYIRFARARNVLYEKTEGCINCYKVKRTFDEEYARNKIQEKYNGEIELLEYHGWTEMGKIKCNRCGTISEKIIGALITHKNNITGCSHCCHLKMTGSNHHNWKGGTLPIDDYLRNAVKKWREDSFKFYDNKCLISRVTTDLVVHHVLKSFLELRDEIFNEYNIDKFTVVENIDQDTLIILRNEMIKKHFQNGYRVPMSNELHKEFHSIYGKSGTNVWQYIDFASTKGVKIILENNVLKIV